MIRLNRDSKLFKEKIKHNVPNLTKFIVHITVKVLKTEKSNSILSLARDHLEILTFKGFYSLSDGSTIYDETLPVRAADLFYGNCDSIEKYYMELDEDGVEGTSGIWQDKITYYILSL